MAALSQHHNAEPRQLWILAGGNGAGKSTFYNTRLQSTGIAFVNADEIATRRWHDQAETNSLQAAILAETQRNMLLRLGRSFCFETVFSHPSKIDFVHQAKRSGYEVILVYIHLYAPQLHLARVAQRVQQGGHSVPQERVLQRLPRTLRHISQALVEVDTFYLLDNSSARDPFLPIVSGNIRNRVFEHQPLPDWALQILSTASSQ